MGREGNVEGRFRVMPGETAQIEVEAGYGFPSMKVLCESQLAAYRAGKATVKDISNPRASTAMLACDLRRVAGLTQRALAERIDTSPSGYQRCEDTKIGIRSLSMLCRIAAACGREVIICTPMAKTLQDQGEKDETVLLSQ
jgi:hypothetical protein